MAGAGGKISASGRRQRGAPGWFVGNVFGLSTMETVANPQEFTFQAEIKQLLHLFAHSLYQSKEIAVRELVSNASDALDKMRFVALTDESQRDNAPLEITLEGRKDVNELVLRDNGVGMTHDELVTTSVPSRTVAPASS